MAYKTWTGTVTEYKTLHRTINKMFGKENVCEDCGDTNAKRYEWANLSGAYSLLREDWKRLCVKCHRALDAASYVGSRFTGKVHKPESRSKTAATMRQYWIDNPEKMRAAQAKAACARRENNLERRK